MHQLQVPRVGKKAAQRLNQTETHPAATMNRKPSRFINDQQIRVIEEDRGTNSALPSARRCSCRFGFIHFKWRHAHSISGLHAIFGLGSPLIHPHLPFPNRPVDPSFGDARCMPEQKVVQTLARLFSGNIKQSDL
jgi:hypothetical protein